MWGIFRRSQGRLQPITAKDMRWRQTAREHRWGGKARSGHMDETEPRDTDDYGAYSEKQGI